MPLHQTIAAAARSLHAAGIADAATEARILCAAILGIDRTQLYAAPQRELTAAESAAIADAVARRAAHEPVARILGRREFWSMDFALSPATLVPRPDSETLIDAALTLYPDRRAPLRILDLGTGTGCLLLALLGEFPLASGIGTDIAPDAVKIAAQNAERLGFSDRARFVVADWADALTSDICQLSSGFDLILSNPPYIAHDIIAALDPEVRDHDPRAALDGGADGLDAYRALAGIIPGLLKPDGYAVIEIGYDQMLSAADIFTAAGFPPPRLRRDLAGQPRCLILKPASL